MRINFTLLILLGFLLFLWKPVANVLEKESLDIEQQTLGFTNKHVKKGSFKKTLKIDNTVLLLQYGNLFYRTQKHLIVHNTAIYDGEFCVYQKDGAHFIKKLIHEKWQTMDSLSIKDINNDKVQDIVIEAGFSNGGSSLFTVYLWDKVQNKFHKSEFANTKFYPQKGMLIETLPNNNVTNKYYWQGFKALKITS